MRSAPVALVHRTGHSFIIEGSRSPVTVWRAVGPLLRRAGYLAMLSVGLFYAVHAMPGGAAGAYRALDPELTPSEIQRLLALEGGDLPLYRRYLCWLGGRTRPGCERWLGGGVLRGDLGYSRVHGQPVRTLLGARLKNTLRLMVPALLIAVLGAVVAGLWSARRVGTWADRLLSAATFVGQSTPLQWVALIAVLVASVYARVLPPGGVAATDDDSWGQLARHAVLPVVCLAGYHGAYWTRYVRLELLSVAARPFVVAARARGLPEAHIWRRHILPNALGPLVTSVSLALPSLFSGALVIETVFSYPGVGLLMVQSVREQDHLTAMVLFMIYAALAMLATSVADAVVLGLDPRAGTRRKEAS